MVACPSRRRPVPIIPPTISSSVRSDSFLRVPESTMRCGRPLPYSSAPLESVAQRSALVLAGGGRWARFGFLVALTPGRGIHLDDAGSQCHGDRGGDVPLDGVDRPTARGRRENRNSRLFLSMATVAACVLVTVRTLGPMWLGLIVLTVVVGSGRTLCASSLSPRSVVAASRNDGGPCRPSGGHLVDDACGSGRSRRGDG